jgi:hypothetical protein
MARFFCFAIERTATSAWRCIKVAAEGWFGWLDAMASEARDRIVGRMKQRMKGQGGHDKV